MKRAFLKLLLWMNLLFAVIAYLSGCATTKPNTPFAGPYPQCFNELSSKNPLLANELAKLPEFQDGITNDENMALEKLVTLYNKNQGAFDKAFQEMYQVGKPEVRKYCSPLQAVFWLAEDSKSSEVNEIIESYSLDSLLKKAWVFTKSTDMGPTMRILNTTGDQTQSIISQLSKNKQEMYKGLSNKNKIEVLLHSYKNVPGYFSKNAEKILKSHLKEVPNEFIKHSARWKDFDTVMDRLNSPELVEKYLEDYVYRHTYMPQSPKTTIKTKRGDCKAYAILSCTALKKSGYKSYLYSMNYKLMSGHTICVFEQNGLYTLDNKYGLIGPFETNTDILNQTGHSYGISESVPQIFYRFN